MYESAHNTQTTAQTVRTIRSSVKMAVLRGLIIGTGAAILRVPLVLEGPEFTTFGLCHEKSHFIPTMNVSYLRLEFFGKSNIMPRTQV